MSTQQPLISPLAKGRYPVPSSNHGGIRKSKVTHVVWHIAGNGNHPISLDNLMKIAQNPKRIASWNYGIGADGEIASGLPENYQPYTTSNRQIDDKSITIEVVNSSGYPDWKVSDESFDSMVVLGVDIARRHGIKTYTWTGDKNGNLHSHDMYANTICMGAYLKSKMPELVRRTNELLKQGDIASSPIILRVQTGAFKELKNAQDLEKKVKAKGFDTYLVQGLRDKLYRVQVGAYAQKDNAIAMSQKLQSKGFDTYITSNGDTDSVYIEKEHRYTNEEMALRVIAGHYGTGQTRIDNLIKMGYDPKVIQTLVNDILIKNQPVKMKEFLKLHSNVTAWRVYPVGVSRVPQNAIGILNPRLFGGLEYEILEKRENGNVAIIQTKDFGKVQIWIGSDVKSLYFLIWR